MVIRVDIDRRGRLYYVDTETGRYRSAKDYQKQFVPPKLEVWRLTVAINFFVSHKYYSYRIQRWGTKEELEAVEAEEKRNCLEGLEKEIGYPQDEWWFPDVPNVSYDEAKKLHGRSEVVEKKHA